MQRTLWEDDAGAHVLLEYIFSLIVTAILFAFLLLVLNTLIANTDAEVLDEEFSIVANDLASRISGFSNEVYINRYSDSFSDSSMSDYGVSIDLPRLNNGKQYRIAVTFDASTKAGTVSVSDTYNVAVNKTAAFHSSVDIDPASFYSTGGECQLYYSQADDKIIFKES